MGPEQNLRGKELDEREHHVCPRCKARTAVEVCRVSAVLGLLTVWPLLPLKRRFVCNECGYQWKRCQW